MGQLEAEARNDKDLQYEILVIGNTNVGKSTFLTAITGMKNFFNTSTTRETSAFWKFKVDINQTQPFALHIHEVVTSTGEVLQDDAFAFQRQEEIIAKIQDMKNKEFEGKPIVKKVKKTFDEYKEGEMPEEESDEDQFHSLFDDINPEDGMPRKLMNITIGIRKEIAAEKFKIISDRVCLVDMPGVDDAVYSQAIFNYIKDNHAKIIPILLVQLSQGSFKHLRYYMDIIKYFRKMKLHPTVIYTKIENLMNDIRCKIIEERIDDVNVLKTKEEVDHRVLYKLKYIIDEYSNEICESLPHSRFVIYDPKNRDFEYRFVRAPGAQATTLEIRLF